MGARDLRNMMKEAQRLQAEVAENQRKLGEARVEATAGGGVVKAIVTGQGELIKVEISPEVARPEDAELLSDLVVAAVQEAQTKAKELAQQTMAPLARFLPPGFTV
ncbi:TPA: YbaB/EbfC family nucleoid-associated protein [Candidatus Acetothermia bacterium]|nr:YbaB/EbfC family nucleoid-associated protein [Candidatus Acetothermia bacterium]HAZ30272.1 YbaB/EbfC family nucleoid-associated protein [Candidatus Acetothermia bacterium]